MKQEALTQFLKEESVVATHNESVTPGRDIFSESPSINSSYNINNTGLIVKF